MQTLSTATLRRVVTVLTALLILKVTVSVILTYYDYFPANFNSSFLEGRESYFFGSYQWAFYSHIASGPISLVLGTILMSDQFRRRFPNWHRGLGKVQAVCVLFVVAPSGLWMGFYAATGTVAALGFSSLALATATTVAVGWRKAVQRRFAEHRLWMCRCFLLLCSAVVIRMIGGLTLVTQVDAEWIYPMSAWVSWLVPLTIFESSQWIVRTQLQSRQATKFSVIEGQYQSN